VNNEVKWYVAHTYSGYERKTSEAIEKAVDARNFRHLISQTVVPCEIVTVADSQGVQRKKERLLYPGYVFVKMAATNPQAWHLVRNVRGVTGFVGENNKPVPLSPDEIETIGVEKDAVQGSARTAELLVGDKILIIDGPLDGSDGQIIEIDSLNSRVKVAVTMFGRDTEVDLESNQVRKI